MNTFREIFKASLPRLINCFNFDPASKSYGYGDRLHWGWKVSDFQNATMQGGLMSLAVAYKLDILSNRYDIVEMTDSIITSLPQIYNSKGGVGEAYPTENSFCVTALVAHDILFALDILGETIDKESRIEYYKIIEPMIQFITKYNEEHAIISNHLATGVAAICIWNKLTGNRSKRHLELLEIIYEHQSKEGWHKEYEGADPGYNSLCLYYLASAYRVWKNEKLATSIKKAASFIEYFIHPDGTIGGIYGSRNTEIYYPGGISFAEINFDSISISKYVEEHFDVNVQITPLNIDIGNFVPLLNSYAFHIWNGKTSESSTMRFESNFEKNFSDAGIFIRSTNKYYAIINYKKGGVIKVFDKENNSLDTEDGGIILSDKNNDLYSSQFFNNDIDFENFIIESKVYKISESYPTPLNFIIIRLLSLTIFRSIYLGNLFKKAIVKMLMTGKKPIKVSIVRRFQFSEDKIEVLSSFAGLKTDFNLEQFGKFKTIHMASSGYGISYENQKRKLVSFIS